MIELRKVDMISRVVIRDGRDLFLLRLMGSPGGDEWRVSVVEGVDARFERRALANAHTLAEAVAVAEGLAGMPDPLLSPRYARHVASLAMRAHLAARVRIPWGEGRP